MDNSSFLIECSLSYILFDKTGTESERGEAQASLDLETLSILPQFKETLYLSYRDILDITPGEYTIQLSLISKEKFIHSNLGYQYEDFLRILIKQRNELLLKDMLMNESVKKAGVEAEFAYLLDTGQILQQGLCEPRLYETALVIMPERSELIRIYYSDIVDVRDEDYQLIIITEAKEKIILTKLGKEFDPFKKALAEVMNALNLKVQSFLKEIMPQLDAMLLRRVTRLMREGKAAPKKELDVISPQIWLQLEKRIDSAGIKDNYIFLKSLSQPEEIAIGIKRGLLGDLTGEYLWILFPIYSDNRLTPGNAVALEAVNINTAEPEEEMDPESSGKATYFFRLVSRKDYPTLNLDELYQLTDTFITQINRDMRVLNFRREPIYFSEERLSAPQNIRYFFAVQKLPGLRKLRDLFIGRVIHSTFEQWQQDILDLLQFNIATSDDTIKWEKDKK
jgi:hypothetical protein